MPNTINIVQPKAEDGVTEVSFVTRTNSIFKPDGSPLGDSMDAYMDEVDKLSQDVDESHYNRFGTATNINSYNSSTNQYTCPSDGYIFVQSGGTANDISILTVEGRILGYAQTQVTNYSHIDSVYVRKGMRAYVSNNTGSRGTFLFVPLVAE